MIYMVTSTFPMESSVDVGKAYQEAMAKKLHNMNEIGIWLSFGGDGMKSVSIQEVEKGYEDEAFKALTNYFVSFIGIEGFKVTIEPVFTPAEGLPFLGITPPS